MTILNQNQKLYQLSLYNTSTLLYSCISKKEEKERKRNTNLTKSTFRLTKKKNTNIFEIDQKKNMQKNFEENKQKKKGKQKNSVPQAFLGQFRTDNF